MFSIFCVGTEDQAQLVEESIKHAKEAVMLDIKDGNSWCKILFLLEPKKILLWRCFNLQVALKL